MLQYDYMLDDIRIHIEANDLGIDVTAYASKKLPVASMYLEHHKDRLVLRYWNSEDFDYDPTQEVVLWRANGPRADL